MPMAGGVFPFDALEALSGPARTLIAPLTTAISTDPYTIVPAINTDGEYPAGAGWRDTGLSADSPSYSHGKDVEGLEFEQASGALFQKVTEINRSFTMQIAGIAADNLQLIENAPAATTVAASANKAAGKRIAFGLYQDLARYRICMVSQRPVGAGVVTEPGGATRPPMVYLVLYEAGLAAEDAEFEFAKGDPVNASVQFTPFAASGQPVGKEHGFWWVENSTQTIAAV